MLSSVSSNDGESITIVPSPVRHVASATSFRDAPPLIVTPSLQPYEGTFFLNIGAYRKARSSKRILLTERKNIKIGLTVAISKFDRGIMKTSQQSSTTLKFMKT